MRLEITDAGALVGRWIIYRRLRAHLYSKLWRSYVQEAHPGGVVGLVEGLAFAESDYPRRPPRNACPWFEALDELEIHSVVEVVEAEPPPPPAPP
jgi:hypothetical protein